MDELKYQPVAHGHQVFLEKAMNRKGFTQACKEDEDDETVGPSKSAWCRFPRSLLYERCR